MHRHLQKIKDTLSPLYDASYAKRFAKNETNQSFVDALKQVRMYTGQALQKLHKMVGFLSGCPVADLIQ